MSIQAGPKLMLVGVQLTLLAVLSAMFRVETVAVVLAVVGSLLVVGGYRFD